jgi:hypothetical protein
MHMKEKMISLPSSELNQKEPNKLQLLWSQESWGDMHTDIRLYAMMPGFDGEKLPDELRKIIYKHMTPLQEELEAIVRSQLPESKEWKKLWLKKAAEMLKESGFGTAFVEEIPNEYCKCCPHKVWLKIQTACGIIKMGWRKRVLVLDWSQTVIHKTALQLFKDEQVTMDNYMIHCWGYEKATEYLKVLQKEFGILAQEGVTAWTNPRSP